MQPLSRCARRVVGICATAIALCFMIKMIGIVWIYHHFGVHPLHPVLSYSYLGSDFPERWPISQSAVYLAFDESQHFQLEKQDGVGEWNALVPGNGVVHLGPYMQPFTVALMHQLKCLDIIRDELVQNRTDRPYTPSNLGRHCLNYLRQIVMCHGGGALESIQYLNHIDTVDTRIIYECKDWEAVRREVSSNQKS